MTKEEKLDSIINKTKLNLNQKNITDVFCILQSNWEEVASIVDNTKSEQLVNEDYLDVNKFILYIFWKENTKIYKAYKKWHKLPKNDSISKSGKFRKIGRQIVVLQFMKMAFI